MSLRCQAMLNGQFPDREHGCSGRLGTSSRGMRIRSSAAHQASQAASICEATVTAWQTRIYQLCELKRMNAPMLFCNCCSYIQCGGSCG